MEICVLKKHLKSSLSELNKKIWSWMYPKQGLKVARKTI